MAESVQTDVLIVGAGLAGLNAARVLKDAGIPAVVVDEGRSVGGRMATRRIGEATVDHGAQFFTVRDPEFNAMVDMWIASGLVFEWSRGWSDGSLVESRDGHPRYAVKGGMTTLMKHLAQDIDVRLNVKLTTINPFNDGWRATDGNDSAYHARVVLLTAPVPQSLALLDAGHAVIDADNRKQLDAIQYEPCLVGMFVIDGEAHLPPPGAIQRQNVPIQWLADNRRKGISKVTVLTAQASSQYSAQMWEQPDETIISAMRVDILPFLSEDATVSAAEIKRWTYSTPVVLHAEQYLLSSEENGAVVAFAGDAFAGPGVEGAILSGLKAGRALVERLK